MAENQTGSKAKGNGEGGGPTAPRPQPWDKVVEKGQPILDEGDTLRGEIRATWQEMQRFPGPAERGKTARTHQVILSTWNRLVTKARNHFGEGKETAFMRVAGVSFQRHATTEAKEPAAAGGGKRGGG